MSRKILIEDDASQYDSINQRLRRLESTLGVLGVKWGVATVDWPGGSATSNFSAAISHGIGRTPAGILLTPQSQSITGAVFAWREGLSSTTFTFRATTLGFTPSAGTTQTFLWVAVG